MAKTLLSGVKRPVLAVDRADFELGRQWVMINAAVPIGGRAVSIYEQVYPFKRYNSPGAHRGFLAALEAVLPEGCRPIGITTGVMRHFPRWNELRERCQTGEQESPDVAH